MAAPMAPAAYRSAKSVSQEPRDGQKQGCPDDPAQYMRLAEAGTHILFVEYGLAEH
jgi:hypothetical protein